MSNQQFRLAAEGWTETLNERYDLNADTGEVIDAFDKYCNIKDEEYINTFFKTRGGNWSTCLDTEDREGILSVIRNSRRKF